MKFESILPEEIAEYEGNLILTTKKESPKELTKPILNEEVLDQHPTITRGKIIQKLELRFENEELIIGIDPGHRIGLSIFFYGKEIENSLYTSVDNM